MLIHDLIIFIILSLINTFISIKLPISLFHADSWLYRERSWERKGQIYQDYVWVKKWKNQLPELSDFLTFLFSKKKMAQLDQDYLYLFVLETCRAELTHWCIIWSMLAYSLWRGTHSSILVLFIAVALNLPYVVIQRYNRPRVLDILANRKIHINENMKNNVEVFH
ncbi:hypothetical protein [Sporolactobacillus vineae]|uniref:glycosyl-4,4'-diaponeurosporenoate acyltransferase CrtO family protein n=1 Tax=Sporolactobacillus vineae TaxID=444463 RepID=UPI000288905F|nr:hypothetical protein [Sporolactobacillus vineae]